MFWYVMCVVGGISIGIAGTILVLKLGLEGRLPNFYYKYGKGPDKRVLEWGQFQLEW